MLSQCTTAQSVQFVYKFLFMPVVVLWVIDCKYKWMWFWTFLYKNEGNYTSCTFTYGLHVHWGLKRKLYCFCQFSIYFWNVKNIDLQSLTAVICYWKSSFCQYSSAEKHNARNYEKYSRYYKIYGYLAP